MKVTQFTPYASPGVRNEEPLIRVSGTTGEGCPCGCSPGFWVSVSDGKTGLLVHFDTKEEYTKALQ